MTLLPPIASATSTHPTPASLHSPVAGDLAVDRRIDAAHMAQAAQAMVRVPTAHVPQPLRPVSDADTPEERLVERYVAAHGTGQVAAVYPTFPKSYLTTTYKTPVGCPTDQKHSGRCWIYANLNVLRTHVLPRYGDKFQYSQNFVAYWDKVERANAFLEKLIEMRDLAPDSQRLLNHLENAFKEGGDWELFRNIVLKYGLVPDHAMPETNFSGNAKGYMSMLEGRLREVGGVLHQQAKAGASREALQAIKNAALTEVRRLLNRYLGRPPETFVWRQANGQLTHLTPAQFYADSGANLASMVHLSNLPYLPMHTRITVDDVNNVVGSPGMECLNVPLAELKEAARRSIKDGVPVMFAAETRESDTGRSLFALGSNATESVAGLNELPRLSKGQRLQYRVTTLAHAMALTGCDDANTTCYAGEPPTAMDAELTGPLWRVENSWRDQQTFYMTDAWFDEYVYAVVVDPKYLSPRTRAQAEDAFTPTRRVNAWDPLGRV